MKKNNSVYKVLVIFLILFFFVILVLSLFLLYRLQLKEKEQLQNSIPSISIEKSPTNVKEVIEKHGSEYIEQINNDIYVSFAKDLYDENGKSNENYFKNIIEDLKPFFEGKNFSIIDEEKNIIFKVIFNEDNEVYDLTINEQDDFYSNTDGESYVNVEKAKIVSGSHMAPQNYLLQKISYGQGFLKNIEEILGEGHDLGNGYISYQEGAIKIRTVPSGAIKNIIFSKDFKDDITFGINSQMSLEEIKEVEPNNDFGSIYEDYLGYRQVDYYLFFYRDEISVYTYSYKENTIFEEILEEYIETRDLNKFVERLSKKWKPYDSFEYDEKTQSAKILYSTRGVEINIEDNNPKGITLYNNYYFTDLTKQYVKNGLINYENKDLVEIVESERRDKSNN